MILMGAVFLASGGGAITLWIVDPKGWSGNGGSWVIYLVGGLFVLVGTLLLSFSADRRYEIDRTSGAVHFVTQGVVHRRVKDYRLDDLTDTALERAQMQSKDGPTFRIVFLTRDGTRVPWTPFYTSDEAGLAACASVVREFCGWVGDETVPAAPPRPLVSAGAVSGHPVATTWGCLGAFLSIFVAVGLGVFGSELIRLETWRPVSARVLSTGVKTVSGSKGNTYAPLVTYEYSVAGASYSCDQVLTISFSSGEKWAEGIRDRFHPGDAVTAYVNPGDPSKAYLVRDLLYFPLLFVAIPIGMALLVAWAIRKQRQQVAAVARYAVPILDA